MLIVMQPNATREQVNRVCARVRELGFEPQEIGEGEVAVAICGGAAPVERFSGLPGVARCEVNGEAPRLAARSARPQGTVVSVRGERIGGGGLTVIAGPCAIESHDQAMRAAETVASAGVKLFRGGAFKPRTSPYSFQGLGEEGLRILEQVRESFGLGIVTEARDVQTLPAILQVADLVQIGARNMQNYALLEAVGRQRSPVLLKRGMGARVSEWLMAAEYLLALGNSQVALCERGIRTFESLTRNTFDLAGAVAARRLTHLPVIADPSHAVGMSWAVPALARASAAAGLDGVMVEVHPNPAAALSDGQQALDPAEFRTLIDQLAALAAAQAPTASTAR